MKGSYLRRDYPEDRRRFFEDFDRLPPEIRRALDEGDTPPTLLDIREALERTGDVYPLDKVVPLFHAFGKRARRSEARTIDPARIKTIFVPAGGVALTDIGYIEIAE